MTLEEIVLNKMVEVGFVEKEAKDDVSQSDIKEMIESAFKESAHLLNRLNQYDRSNEIFNKGMCQLMTICALEYGEAKWNEAVEATRKAIAEDNPVPPHFTP